MMKVLWLSADSALYEYAGNRHGGWISSLQAEVIKRSDLRLAVAFPWQYDFVSDGESCVYYGIKAIHHPIFGFARKQKQQMDRLKVIVEDFQPDVIHVFGTENGLGLVGELTTIPVVVHIQGVLGPYCETFVPYNMSWADYLIHYPKAYVGYNAWRKFIPREREIFRHCRYFMGRTEWDNGIVSLLSPHARYYHCDELLRSEIMNGTPWHYHGRKPYVITSVIGGPIYKGTDIILRTAALLKAETNLDFVWYVYGVNDLRFGERLTGISGESVGVFPKGMISAGALVAQLQDSSLYVHPSYIENSSNAICEAQYMGLPVIATNVGGTSTLIKHNTTGILVPSNDIYSMAAQIQRVIDTPALAAVIGTRARETAQMRHDANAIVNRVIQVYEEIKQ